MMVMVMRSEVMPRVMLRVLSQARGNTFDVTELEINNAEITSISLGGSGGEHRLTENISISFQAILFRVLKIDKNTGTNLPFVSALCKTLRRSNYFGIARVLG